MGVKVEKLLSRSTDKETSVRRFNYWTELKQELKKVTWTAKDELILFTKIVVGTTFIFGLGIYVVDLLIKGVLTGFARLVHLIFG